jgi:hemolysin III
MLRPPPTPADPPLLRGYIHFGAAIATAAATPLLFLVSASARAYVSAAVFAASLLLLFATSATYHLLGGASRDRRALRRADHAMIFVAVAGMYTPFCLQVLGTAWGISLLSVVWGLAGVGIVVGQVWHHAPRWFGVSLYVALGWVAVVATSELVTGLAPWALSLMLASGVVFTVGGVIYAIGRPSPFPRVFGHHEVFHTLVAVGCGVIYCVVLVGVLPG